MTVTDAMHADRNRIGKVELFQSFVSRYPEYAPTTHIDDLRKREFTRLDRTGSVYLDYTGSGLYGEFQVTEHTALLLNTVYGNPHSLNPTSVPMTDLIEKTRAAILRYFNASPAEYTAIFTLNASAALKLVGESYPFNHDSTYLLTFDNHNSVNGIREFARKHDARIMYAPITVPDMRIDEEKLLEYLNSTDPDIPKLFAYPAQSNFSGIQHSLHWIEIAQNAGWDVILDAAAFVPTNKLDLNKWHPDFVPVSFYKMFGYPTGVGCLIARRDALARLKRPWFAGGTITVASVQGDKYYLAEGESGFEDGTLNFLSIPAVGIGLRFIDSIGLESIHKRISCLTGWLLENLLSLHHNNGRPLVRLYGSHINTMRGGALTMNFYTGDGSLIDHRFIEQKANEKNISLRTGCFCNPGGGEVALGLSKAELVSCFNRTQSRLTLDDFRQCIDDKGTGAVRVSTGLASNFEDVSSFITFAQSFLR
jgi:molybdenum cofactor sulfurtransferase